MIPKPTEDTVTNLLARELEKRGVKAETFPIISTPSGNRKPDIWCVNGGAYAVEAKFKEKDLFDAIAKVQNDYLKFHDLIGIKGGFAILYPEELAQIMPLDVVQQLSQKLEFKAIATFPPKDKRNFTVYEGTLPEIADILAEHILTPPEFVEPSTAYIVRALRESAIYITLTLKFLSGKDLESLFGGREVFANILQYDEEKYPIEALRLASAYLLINQLLFYHVLSRRIPEQFAEIDTDAIDKPEDLNAYFRSVLDVNYRTVFSYDVASRMPPAFADRVKAVVNVVKALSPEKVGGDLLGTIFHDLVPFQVRKNVAAFYTNVLAAELLAWLSIDDGNAKVADLAVGSGGLLVAAYRRKRHLLEADLGKFNQKDHKRFLEGDLLGIDVMPFAANVAACHLALQIPEYFTNKVNIAIWDSTGLEPNMTIPSMAGLKFVFKGQTGLESFLKPLAIDESKGVVSLSRKVSEEINLETYDDIIMNPPFTRHERMPKEYKAMLIERFKDYNEYLHGQLGYSGYFILLADRFLNEGGSMALVLPATSLHIRSAEGIRRLWSERYRIAYIVTTWQRLAFSESTVFREILLVAEKKKSSPDTKTKICVVKRLPETMSRAQDVAQRIRNANQDCEYDDLSIKIRSYSKLRADPTDWYRYVALSDLKLIDLLEKLLSTNKLCPLSFVNAYENDLRHYQFEDFHGFVMGSKERARRKSDAWITHSIGDQALLARHRELESRIEIPLSCLARALRRFSYVKTMDISQKSDFLILGWFDKIKDMARHLVPAKKAEELNAQIVGSWKERFDKRRAHLLLARRLYLSSPGTHLIAFYSKEPTVGIDLWSLCDLDKDSAKILTLWLNSSINLLQLLYLGVACEGPWMKLHKYMLKKLLVPDLKRLSDKEIRELLNVFDEARNAVLPSIREQLRDGNQIRRKIDQTWLRILGYKQDPDVLLKSLYASMLNELEIIDSLMKS